MRYLALLRPEPVKSQPTVSEFNWRAQMFADVRGSSNVPAFLFSRKVTRARLAACWRVLGERAQNWKRKKSLHHRLHLWCSEIFMSVKKCL